MKKATVKENKPVTIQQPGVRSAGLAVFLVLLAGVLAYSNSFDCGFHLDDLPHILNNEVIRKFDPVAIWNHSHNRYLPLLSIALNYQWNGTHEFGYHLFNLMVHMLNALTVMGLIGSFFDTPALKSHPLKAQSKSIALFAALLFVAHPLATQSVTYIVQRMAGMMAFFYLLSMYMYVKGRLDSGRRSVLFFAGAVVSGLCALTSKESSFTLPLAIALVEALFFHEVNIKDVFKNYRFWLAAIVLTGFCWFAFDRFGSSIKTLPPAFMNEYRQITPLDYLFTQFTVIPKYIQLLFLPVGQNLDYDWPVYTSFAQGPVVFGFLFLLSLVVWGVFQWKKNPLYAFGVLFFFLALSIESGLVPIDDVIFEHRTYLPSVGFFCLASAGVHSICVGSITAWLNKIMMACTILLMLLTFQRNKVWKNEETLWTDVISRSPEKTRPRNCRGTFYHQHKHYSEALADYTTAIKFHPSFYEAYFNRAITHIELNDSLAALNDYRMQINLMPEVPFAYHEIIKLYKELGRYQEALVYSDKVITLEPGNFAHYLIRGQLYDLCGRPEEALNSYNQSLIREKNNKLIYYNRGLLLEKMNRKEEAIQDYTMAVSIEKNYPEAYVNRANIYRDMGRYDEALADYAMAIQINPRFEKAFANRGYLYQRKNDFQQAIAELTTAIQILPSYDRALYARAVCYYRLNQLDAACQDLRQAAALGNAQAAPLVPQICNR